MIKEIRIPAKTDEIPNAVQFLEAALKESGVDRKKALRSILAAEELLALMVEHAPGTDTRIRLRVKIGRKQAKISITARGSAFSLEDTETAKLGLDLDELEDEQAAAVKGMLKKFLEDSITLQNLRGINRAEVRIDGAPSRSKNSIFVYLAVGVLLGLALRILLPVSAASFLSVNVLSLVSTIFLNAIRMVVVPVVFFSIAESVASFSDLRSFGRIGGKVMLSYFCTTVVAMLIAFGVSLLIRPGDPALQEAILALEGSSTIAPGEPLTISQIIAGIIPSSFLGALVNADMLQIIFLGILTGVASGLIGEYSASVQHFLHAGNALFGQITKIIVKALPAALLCIMANTALTTDAHSIFALLKLFATTVCGLACMVAFYCLLLGVLGKQNPLRFLQKFRRAMFMAFSTSSSSATMPVSMECMEDMGVSQSIYSFSIPLGATINMDGNSIDYVCILLFMLRVFQIPLTAGSVAMIFLNVLMLSIATPGIPNAALAMLAMLFAQFNIPIGAVAFLMGYNSITDMLRTTSNVTGDAVVTAVVAVSEGMLDEKAFNS